MHKINEPVINYDEDLVGDYDLPPLLEDRIMRSMTDKVYWERVRRGELLDLFSQLIYGYIPKEKLQLKFDMVCVNSLALNGLATHKEVEIKIFRESREFSFRCNLFVPVRENGSQPCPVFLLIDNRPVGQHNTPTDTQDGFWPIEEMLCRGYAMASFHVNEVAPDHPVNFKDRALQLFPEVIDDPSGAKAISIWAWGASRVLDYLESDSDIDSGKVIIAGHSRTGKTALWAAANDRRFAGCMANNTGNTGAAISRRNYGETIERINTRFPHWFCDKYKTYNDNVHALPVDQHMLLALIAPRPLYITSASEDRWADPKGMYLSLIHASQIYADIYGLSQSWPEQQPEVNSPIFNQATAYHMREGRHDLTLYDWLQFASFIRQEMG